MDEFIEELIERARADRQTIVLPETEDPRTVEAAREVIDRGIADVIVLGSPKRLAEHGVDLHGIPIVDPATYPKRELMAQTLYEIRKSRGLTLEEAHSLLDDPLYFGTMMVKMGEADGMVAGSLHATADVLRPALRILHTAPGVDYFSSTFIMFVPNRELGDHGRFAFADCAVNDDPTTEQLADIAIATARTFKSLLRAEPRVAMLSYSTYGSAKGHLVDKARDAVEIVRAKAPEIVIDGELQLDAAVIPEVAHLKAPGSPVAGRANVLIFPSLESGNIGYKLAERMGGAKAFGPISQGLGAPVSDLSRGCTAKGIVGVVAITAIQAQDMKRVNQE